MSTQLHQNTVEFQITSDYALFSDVITRPGGERISYPIPTYEAIKGIIHSVYWKPTIIWVIDSVRVMNRICTSVKGIRPIKYGGGNDLSYHTYLYDVHYQVRAHFEWNENRPEMASDRNRKKHLEITKRMIERGGRRDVFLGLRECQGYVEPCVFGEDIGYYDNDGISNYGLMYHGFTYPDEAILPEDKGKLTVRFWNPIMKNGIIDYIRPEECNIKRHLKDMSVKNFTLKEETFDFLAKNGEVEEH